MTTVARPSLPRDNAERAVREENPAARFVRERRTLELKYTDSIHAYYLTLDADDVQTWGGRVKKGARCKSVTAVAKIPDNQEGIVKWRMRRLAVGLARSPQIIESVAAHFTDDAKVNDLIEEAMIVGGGNVASESGTAAHRVTERTDLGEDMILTSRAEDVQTRWLALLEIAGIEIVTHFVERCVVYPAQLICGKFDRVGRVLPGGTIARLYPELVGKLVMLDLKTGKGATKYPHGTACQLALYANAPLMADFWSGLDGLVTKFDPLPEELDRNVGFIVSITTEESAIYSLNIAAGWRAIERVIFPAVAWRKVPKADLVRRIAALDA